MTLEKDSLILADYTAKIKDTGQIIDTTRKEDAEKAGDADPTRTYEPRLIAVGEGWVLKGLDEALEKADPNQTIDVELTPDKAFGVRDPNKVSRIPIRKFGEKASELSIGSEVEVDNRMGIVRSLESGRAIVDFNHKYAGKTLLYNVDIKEKVESRDAQIQALIHRRLPVEKDKIKFESVGEEEVKISIPSDFFLLEGLQIIKRGISSDLFKFIKPLSRVTFIETFENPVLKKEEEAKPETTSEAASPEPQAEKTQAASATESAKTA
jgi:FKBP-type peptidyl-prolyl cis-trans isomerase 2